MKQLSIIAILFCCLMASCSKNNSLINASDMDFTPSAMISTNTPTLSEQDSMMIVSMASKVSPELRAKFERKRAEWKDACNKSDIRYSSFMHDYTKPAEFTELVSMGEPIIPLVIEKMAQGDFFMQLVYEGIRPDEKFADSNDSGQRRAADYVKSWVETAKRQAK